MRTVYTNVLLPCIYGANCSRCFFRMQSFFCKFISETCKIRKRCRRFCWLALLFCSIFHKKQHHTGRLQLFRTCIFRVRIVKTGAFSPKRTPPGHVEPGGMCLVLTCCLKKTVAFLQNASEVSEERRSASHKGHIHASLLTSPSAGCSALRFQPALPLLRRYCLCTG